MARTKKSAPVVTMEREVLPNGDIRLTSTKGIMDIRSYAIYPVAICKPKLERFFKEAEAEV